MTLRDTRVRKKLHEIDRSRSSYPTSPRTGDANRLGRYRVTFDDTDTIIYKTNASISYPTTLELGSPYLASDLSSSLAVRTAGNIKDSAIEQWIQKPYGPTDYPAFNEDGRFLYDQSSTNFFLTGTNFSDIGSGFSSRLTSKTAIRIELPLQTVLPLLVNTASTYYYDDAVRQFSLVTSSVGGRRGFGTNPANTPAAGVGRLPLYFGTLFTPIGTYSNESTTDIVGGFFGRTATVIKDLFFRVIGSSVLTGSSTNPSASQALNMSRFISQPFLLEKCIVEFPFAANAGWFSDRTRFSAVNDNSIESRFTTDFGGPAITFGLLNYLGQNNQKDLITAGAIIPDFDDVRALCLNQIRDSSNVLQSTVRTPEGFRSFADPAYVVKRRDGETSFTGSIRMHLECSSSVGIGTVYTTERAGSSGLANYFSASFAQSSLFLQNVVGRTKSGNLDSITGRSAFGKTLETPSLVSSNIVSRNHDLYVASGTSAAIEDFVYYSSDLSRKSPYLLFPNDKLVIALSKYRPAWVSSSVSGPFGNRSAQFLPTTNASLWHYPSSSHAVSIGSGTLRITLYGSLIKEGSEFHDTLNSRLDTNQVHEAIGMEPVLDQFDVFYSSELTGSLSNQFKVYTSVPYLLKGQAHRTVTPGSPATSTPGFAVTGAISNATVFSHVSSENPIVPFSTFAGSWSTQYNFLKVRHLNEIRKSSRNIVLSSKELFWDSRLPDPKQAAMVCNPRVYLAGYDGPDTYSYYRVLYTGTTSTLGDTGGGLGDWMMSYPYEPKYSSVPQKFFESLGADNFMYKNPGAVAAGLPATYRYENINIEVGDTNNRVVAGETAFGGADVVGLGYSEFVKVFYGTGDGRSRFDNHHVKFRYNVNASLSGINWASAILRGWRYGMISGFPLYSTAVYRRDRFGQMRDMLEQRVDTRFYNEGELGPVLGVLDAPISVKFVNSKGDSVKSYETMSSNLSLEATSSLPYFDGFVRNREEPISLSRTNQSIIVI